MSCAIKYETMGLNFKKLGSIRISEDQGLDKNQGFFYADLIHVIKNYQDLKDTTDKFKFCFGNLFLIQVATSAVTICGSVYAVAFSSFQTPVFLAVYAIVMIYSFFDIYVVAHFGNEIKHASSHLSDNLFESNWFEQPKSCKKIILILMEILRRPQQLVIAKVYPLDLDIFTRILRIAYSMFNILQSFN
ncbi:Odorant receptor 4 [Pseudolycoriella hygida]|uniref:Odorant receptor 4 n=1 Tax=Pseudolycoriella hygida TaxID=35572 RepID=A0A9Q0NGG0_9DIPT|nr:Odorant receptor 4 [Pseudolycoriella hygida]